MQKELLLANLEGELKKKGTDVIYQEVVKEVEVERIVTEIEYRDVEIEVIKEVEKIVKEIEYRDVEVSSLSLSLSHTHTHTHTSECISPHTNPFPPSHN